VQGGQALIKGDQPPLPNPSQLRQVRIGDLPMPDHSGERDITIRNRISPELVPIIRHHTGQNGMHGDRRLPFPDQHPQQSALRAGTAREVIIGADQPALRSAVVNVLGHD
jgi:hypothetical protein